MSAYDLAKSPPISAEKRAYVAFQEIVTYADALSRVGKPLTMIRLKSADYDALLKFARAKEKDAASLTYGDALVERVAAKKRYNKKRIHVAPDLAAFVR